MTIVVGVATPDGLVLAADSRTTMFPDGSSRSRVASDSADKVFGICGRFGVATYGDAFVGGQTIAGLMTEFVAQLSSPPADVEALATNLGAFFGERYTRWREDIGEPVAPDEGARLGFIVGGYDEHGIGHFHEVTIPGPEVSRSEINTTTGGLIPRGQNDVIDRLIRGVDLQVLAGLGVDVPDQVADALAKLHYVVQFPITLQDGIDFASFLIRTTIDMQRFSDGTFAFQGGTPGCGGPTKIVVVHRQNVEWVSRPTLRPGRPGGRAEGALDA
jgi:hypothetical protein